MLKVVTNVQCLRLAARTRGKKLPGIMQTHLQSLHVYSTFSLLNSTTIKYNELWYGGTNPKCFFCALNSLVDCSLQINQMRLMP